MCVNVITIINFSHVVTVRNNLFISNTQFLL